MKRGLPVVPMASTIVAVAAANVVLASPLAWLVSGGRIAEYGPLFWAALVVVGVVAGVVAILSWRSYLAGRRPRARSAGRSRPEGERTTGREET